MIIDGGGSNGVMPLIVQKCGAACTCTDSRSVVEIASQCVRVKYCYSYVYGGKVPLIANPLGN